ncbi:MAG TPA: helix-turn-helix domain-containing protein [Devosia sp.]|nr:helix-turn-helix domain-containing protein [Devosia sp.]
MSKQAKQWASRQQIANGPMKSVLTALAYMHREGKDLFPSQAYLANETGLSDRAVRAALRLLSHFGVLSRKARSSGSRGRISDVFTLNLSGDYRLTSEMLSTARKGLAKPGSNRKPVPVAEKLQPEPASGASGTSFRGLGDEQKVLSQISTELSVGHCTHEGQGATGEPDMAKPDLRLIAGGKP